MPSSFVTSLLTGKTKPISLQSDRAEVGLQDGLSVVEKASKTHGSKIEVVES